MQTYWRLLSYAKPIEKYAIPYVLVTVLAVIFNTLNLALLAPLLSTLFKEKATAVAKPESWVDIMDYFNYYVYQIQEQWGAFEALKWVCLCIFLSVLLSNTFRYIAQRVIENLRIYTLLNLRKSVFDQVMDLHLGYFNEQRKGNIIAKITSDVQVVQYSVTSTLQVLFKEPFQLLAYLFILFAISVKLTLFAILVIPVSAFVISKIVKRLKAQATEAQERFGLMVSYLDEALSGIKIIKAFNATERIKKRFHQENVEFSEIGKKMSYRQQLGAPVSELLGVVMVIIIVLYGGSLVISNQSELSASAFITYIAIFSQIMRPAKAITESFSSIHSGIAAGERVLQLIDEKAEIQDQPEAFQLNKLEKGIALKHVSFSYGQEKILKEISMVIPRGFTVALVGPSGGGKSTLMDLIPRFIDPQDGCVSFDGMDIKDVSSDSLRDLIGIVNQESILFHDTIANNIAFGKPTASMEEIQQAAKIANAEDFILKTPKGYHSNIGDRGTKLSGGQKQRICIARAVLKNPPILLLDEATSALDTESEFLVQDALFKLMKNRTTLVIAHRLSTIQNADLIVVLDQGRIIEKGTHYELLVQEGLYSNLIDKQKFTQV
ncbi:ABC transporter ATP-binding protein [Algoriphagus halophytocola]|uniref:ABC transporter ATP-binding protein/permease n=1 Tax=Algoriphagus halophytocola TaxID=2991499 RepID=A0ABY6ML15_9BACT|nr:MULTISPECIES: ABC transporter ATP-binding protein [unclassified Algoriphagus]UZD22899.1 ABC transporter ATP-binding protein/permease [Algoriphagus sp. TR-M5]WBL44167.1 ABC transporter ATP-binding protein [Algoriphagus sp. TR-M9]